MESILLYSSDKLDVMTQSSSTKGDYKKALETLKPFCKKDISKANFQFGIERGNFGKVKVRTTSVPYEECLRKFGIFSKEAEKENLKCQIEHGIGEVISNDHKSSFWSITAHGGIEGDQNYKVQNKVYGASGYYSRDTFPSIGITFDRVNPASNEPRKALVGDEDFDRASVEIAYRANLAETLGYPVWFFVSYRHFYEFSAPEPIESADLDNFGYVSASIRFPARILTDFIKTDETMLFVRYTDGQLPFDLKDQSAVEIGFSTNISALGDLLK